MLEAHGRPLFDHALLSFQRYFTHLSFLFIVRSDHDTPAFVARRCHALGITDFQIVTLDKATRGQAETVALGLTEIDPQMPLTIFNIDTFRPGFALPELTECSDGYLEVFEGEGDNWSYAKPLDHASDRVIETAEKNPISNLCSTGLYHFAHAKDFLQAFAVEAAKPISQWQKQELYIAPLYNQLIAEGKDIRYHKIHRDEVIFCGVPAEFTAYLHAKDPYA
ncbi:capsular biosynthesis protein [Ferrimonas pelagia]